MSEQRLSKLQKWVLLYLLENKYHVPGFKHTVIHTSDIYRGFYHIVNVASYNRHRSTFDSDEIQRRANCAKPAVCLSLRLMIEKGLIQEHPYSGDYCLTDKGRRVAKKLQGAGLVPGVLTINNNKTAVSSPAKPATSPRGRDVNNKEEG